MRRRIDAPTNTAKRRTHAAIDAALERACAFAVRVALLPSARPGRSSDPRVAPGAGRRSAVGGAWGPLVIAGPVWDVARVFAWTMPWMSTTRMLLAPLAALTTACSGTTPVPEDSSGGPGSSGDEVVTAGDDSSGDGSGSSGAPEAEPPPPDPFQLDRANVKLLPFRVRFNRLQQLAGLPAEDPAFDVLRARRYELGDYDYASGVNPDLTWTASRMSVWIAAVLPVCRSPAMLARFPLFPDDLPEFLTAAYGVVPDPDLLADYEVLLGDATLDEPTRHDSVCAVALSSLEFVAQ
jgi:hypothetical protein